MLFSPPLPFLSLRSIYLSISPPFCFMYSKFFLYLSAFFFWLKVVIMVKMNLLYEYKVSSVYFVVIWEKNLLQEAKLVQVFWYCLRRLEFRACLEIERFVFSSWLKQYIVQMHKYAAQYPHLSCSCWLMAWFPVP